MAEECIVLPKQFVLSVNITLISMVSIGVIKSIGKKQTNKKHTSCLFLILISFLRTYNLVIGQCNWPSLAPDSTSLLWEKKPPVPCLGDGKGCITNHFRCTLSI